MIGIIDYGLSNIRSVACALKKIEVEYKVIDNNKSIRDFSGYILPGVGAYNEAMKNIKSKGIDDAIKKEILINKKKILGICLGMQLLTEWSEENKMTRGLGLIKGSVQKIKQNKKFALPHIGWNKTEILSKSKIFQDLPSSLYLYYVHSFCVHVSDKNYILAKTNYGVSINSIISNHENIFGIQPHPEKSQFYGLNILRNFCSL
ncbi:MAG: imidazole glycerol phosphate synthase subunit HisH [Candidatus Endolissoclinum sp. TMED37]|nr:MAG: imidazole glycerol phosphate synthase subunit HisH [Candidatus Endolissoclinum sp. TMED37]